MKSYKFKSNEELLQFIIKEVKNYVGVYKDKEVLYNYNRMTIEELAQEVLIKLLRTVGDVNKKYVRQAVVFVCIDFYRRFVDDCPLDLEVPQVALENDMPERLMQLHKFTKKELPVVMLLLEGKKNSEIQKELEIPKVSYYTLLNRIKDKYSLDL